MPRDGKVLTRFAQVASVEVFGAPASGIAVAIESALSGPSMQVAVSDQANHRCAFLMGVVCFFCSALSRSTRLRSSVRHREGRGTVLTRFAQDASVEVFGAAASSDTAYATESALNGPRMRVAVFGGTGYIGRATVKELAARGHSVVVVTRERSGADGRQSLDEVRRSFGASLSPGAGHIEVLAGDVTDGDSLTGSLVSLDTPVDAAVCCLASRSGGREDSFAIDHRATVNCIQAAKGAGAKHFVLLSAVCIQKPKLAFHDAKILSEAELRASGMTYSIVRPTAFFKSLLGQLEGVRNGAPFMLFGDGKQAKAKPICEADLAAFMADCFWDPAKHNAELPVGGPGRATTFLDRGEALFQLLGREPKYFSIPYWVFGVIQGCLDFFAGRDSDAAELGRIGRYYAEESMLVLDPETGLYNEEMTPSYGKTSFLDYLAKVVVEGGQNELKNQQIGTWQLSKSMSSWFAWEADSADQPAMVDA
mmetsp:Transcript_66767/g.215857  ORF Transcript_66767/g.215857 Transcript_66767/m.215857 type:complete len:479 (-) Transcript_66767:254-1690(-)